MFPELSDRNRKIAALPLFLGFGGVFAASILLPLPGADGRLAHLPSVCPFYALTGLPCPLCGLTRAFVCLGHGDWRASLHWHPIGWLVYAIFAFLWLRASMTIVQGKVVLPVTSSFRNRMTLGTASGLLLVGIVRIAWLTVYHLRF